MTIDQTIAALKKLRDEYGNLEVFDGAYSQLGVLRVEHNDGDNFDPSWHMPETFVVLD